MQAVEPVTFSVPRGVLSDISRLSAELTKRMHDLLERNTDGTLNPTEQAEVQTLVQVAQFGQIISMALSKPQTP